MIKESACEAIGRIAENTENILPRDSGRRGECIEGGNKAHEHAQNGGSMSMRQELCHRLHRQGKNQEVEIPGKSKRDITQPGRWKRKLWPMLAYSHHPSCQKAKNVGYEFVRKLPSPTSFKNSV